MPRPIELRERQLGQRVPPNCEQNVPLGGHPVRRVEVPPTARLGYQVLACQRYWGHGNASSEFPWVPQMSVAMRKSRFLAS